jgi:hypothetical protein
MLLMIRIVLMVVDACLRRLRLETPSQSPAILQLKGQLTHGAIDIRMATMRWVNDGAPSLHLFSKLSVCLFWSLPAFVAPWFFVFSGYCDDVHGGAVAGVGGQSRP